MTTLIEHHSNDGYITTLECDSLGWMANALNSIKSWMFRGKKILLKSFFEYFSLNSQKCLVRQDLLVWVIEKVKGKKFNQKEKNFEAENFKENLTENCECSLNIWIFFNPPIHPWNSNKNNIQRSIVQNKLYSYPKNPSKIWRIFS